MHFKFFSSPIEGALVGIFGVATLQVSTVVSHGWESTVGLLLGGIGFASYWIVKAIAEAKSGGKNTIIHSSDTTSPAVWQKIQEVLDAQKQLHENLIATLKDIHTEIIANQSFMASTKAAIDDHSMYVKEHVGERGKILAQEVGGMIAPLIVNSIRTSFDLERTTRDAERTTIAAERIAASETSIMSKPPRKRKKY